MPLGLGLTFGNEGIQEQPAFIYRLCRALNIDAFLVKQWFQGSYSTGRADNPSALQTTITSNGRGLP
jgi:hypothetical protein